MAEGFFSRWSRTKQLARDIEGQTDGLAKTAAVAAQPAARVQAQSSIQGHSEGDAQAVEPTPDLESAHELVPGADIRRFMQPDVDPGARREALRRLFSDPAYNVISDMDDYVEDYANLPKLSRAELLQLSHVRGLFLFEDPPWKVEAQQRQEQALRAAAAAAPEQPVAMPEQSAANVCLPDDAAAQPAAVRMTTVSPPPAHLSRLRPGAWADSQMADSQDQAQAEVSQAPLANRPYRPTLRQDES